MKDSVPVASSADARHLEGLATPGGVDGPLVGLGDGARGEDVAVRIGVVLEDGQRGGAPRSDAELVVDGLGRGVRLLALGVHDLVGELGGVLRLFGGLEIGLHLVPVVHEHHVLVGQPHGTRPDVVEDDARPVGAELDVTGPLEGVHHHVRVLGGVLADSHVGTRSRPGCVVAALVAHGTRRVARGGVSGGRCGRDGASVQGNADEGVRGGQQHGIRLRARFLEDASCRHTLGAQVPCAPVGEHQGVGGGVQSHGQRADGGEAELGVGGQALDLGGLHPVDSPVAGDGGEPGGRGGHGHHRSLHPGAHHAALKDVRDGCLRGEGGGGGFCGGGHPQGALPGVQDSQPVTSLDGFGAFGQGGRRTQTHRRDLDGGHRTGGMVAEGDRVGVLGDVEIGGVSPQGCVQGPGVVVEVSHQAAGLVRHPDASVIDVDLGGGDALVEEGQGGQDQGGGDQGCCGRTASPAASGRGP